MSKIIEQRVGILNGKVINRMSNTFVFGKKIIKYTKKFWEQVPDFVFYY